MTRVGYIDLSEYTERYRGKSFVFVGSPDKLQDGIGNPDKEFTHVTTSKGESRPGTVNTFY